MSSDVPLELHPVMVVEDRYQGVYSGGIWWAVAEGDRPFEARSRIDWLMEHGPGSDDVTCAVFWGRPPPWVAAGSTPDHAIAKLIGNPEAASDEWPAPRWQDDPRAAGFLGDDGDDD